MRAMALSTQQSLQSFSFSTTGYSQKETNEAFSGFENLQHHLVLWFGVHFGMTAAFFQFLIVTYCVGEIPWTSENPSSHYRLCDRRFNLMEIGREIATRLHTSIGRSERKLSALQEAYHNQGNLIVLACTLCGVTLLSYPAGAIGCVF